MNTAGNYAWEERISHQDFLDGVVREWPETGHAKVIICGWQDGDYFMELCEENGGPKEDNLELFRNMTQLRRFRELPLLVKYLKEYIDQGHLGSEDGNYKFFFDIYVWVGRNLMTYNPHFLYRSVRELGLIARRLGWGFERPGWIAKGSIE